MGHYNHDHGLFLWCDKRQQRIASVVCLHLKCKHLEEKDGNLVCIFKSTSKIRISVRKISDKENNPVDV